VTVLWRVPVARRRDAVATGVGRLAADEVVTFVDGEDEEGVRLVDAVTREAAEERRERIVVGLQLVDVAL